MNNLNTKNSPTTFVGIDVSKRTLDVGIWPDKTSRTFDYEAQWLRQFLKSLPEPGICLTTLEATGGDQRKVVTHLIDAGHLVAVVNPKQVRDFAKGFSNWHHRPASWQRVFGFYETVLHGHKKHEMFQN